MKDGTSFIFYSFSFKGEFFSGKKFKGEFSTYKNGFQIVSPSPTLRVAKVNASS